MDKDKDEDNDEKEYENLLSSSQIPACKAKSGRPNVHPSTFAFVLIIFDHFQLFNYIPACLTSAGLGHRSG